MSKSQEVPDEEFVRLSSIALRIPESRLSGMLKRRVLQNVSGFFPDHYRFDKGTAGFETGTALFKTDEGIETVRGFPKIQRAMILGVGIATHFEGLPEVAVEEKMNGYNVRVASIKGTVIALTRGGLVCPYTTEKVLENVGKDFFIDHPDLVLCGEMVGPDNPYVPKDIYHEVDSISFFIFDIRHKNSGKPLGVDEKHELCSHYNIKTVPYFGKYPLDEASRRITGIIRELGKKSREGVVIKDPEMKLPAIKYTSSKSNNNDLEYAFGFYNDYGKDFFFSRVVREGFQAVEWDEDEEALHERCCRLGESILKPMVNTIKKRRQGERITEDVQIRVHSLDTANKFEEHLRRMGIDAQFDEPKLVDGQYLIVIRKFNQSTNDRTSAILSGQLW
ncbi:MAG: RNA ligase [Methanosarcinales archaeon]|nr:RNA ligase [Methanosarcinales archaeon]